MTDRLPRQHFALLFVALLVTAAGNTALQTVLPAIGRQIGIPDLLVALVFSLSALLWTFSAPFWAEASDKRGRRRLMQVGVAGFGVSMLLCASIIVAGLNGIFAAVTTMILFTLARAIFGIFGSAASPASQAYVASRTSEGERTTALATLSSAFGLGTILGPAIAPLFIIAPLGLSGPMFGFALIAFAVLVALQLGLPDDDPTHAIHLTRGYASGASVAMPSVGGAAPGASITAAGEATRRGKRERLSVRDPRVKPFMIFGFTSGSLQAVAGQTLGFLVIDRIQVPPAQAPQFLAIIFMAGAGATLLAQWGLIRMLRLNPSQLMRYGTLLAALGTLWIAFAADFHALVIAYALASLGYGFARPGFTAGSSLAVGPEEQGGVAGAVTAVNGACFIAAPFVGIGLYELIPTLPYELGAAGLAALLIYAWRNPVLRASAAHREPLADVEQP
ncbi:MFS transporter [Sandaracinobacteroides saxicola]|nr:MFS transporter [Sandaracinobacteroides saxicola]